MKQTNLLVTVSALAISAFYSGVAHAQIVLNCPQRLEVGTHNACSNGSLVINPDGSTHITGCLAILTPPTPAQCTLSTGGVAPTRNVVVSFNVPTIFINSGGQQAKVNHFMMQPVGAPTAQTQFTFTPTEVANTVRINVGATLHFSNGQSIGNYTGVVSMIAQLQ